jgi:hypothetical protein
MSSRAGSASAPLRGSCPDSARDDHAPARGSALERAATNAGREVPIPWALALIPVGALAMAGLLVLGLARFVAIPAAPSGIEASLGESSDVCTPSEDEFEGEACFPGVGPEWPTR